MVKDGDDSHEYRKFRLNFSSYANRDEAPETKRDINVSSHSQYCVTMTHFSLIYLPTIIPKAKKISGKYNICPSVCFSEALLSSTKILLNGPAPSTLLLKITNSKLNSVKSYRGHKLKYLLWN